MRLTTLVATLLRNDVRLVGRDRMLVTLLAMVLVIGFAAREVLPILDQKLMEGGVMPSETTALRFADTFPMLIAFIALWQGALMPGTVFGFLLLDEKEDDTLTAMQVTPVPLARYLGYRVALPTLFAIGFGLFLEPLLAPLLAPVLDQPEPLGWGPRIAIVAGASLVAPITSLLLATFAANKVQGLAFTKFTGIAGLTILIGWFVPLPWQWILALFPPFLICKAYWMALAHHPMWWLVLAIGTALELGALSILLRRFRQLAVH